MIARSTRAGAVVAALATLGTVASEAHAQEYLPAASAHVATGVEGAGGGLRRARTRLRLGLELRIDEAPDDALALAGLVDVEPRAAFGAELRYMRSLSSLVAIGAGPIAYFAPGTLLGASAGVEVRPRIGKKTFLLAGPEATVFAFGSDLPNNTVLWQALMQVGVRADF